MPGTRADRRDIERGKRLRVAMAERGVGPGQLARDVGVSNVTVSRWLAGELPSHDNLERIAHVLRFHRNWLESGDGPRLLEEGGNPGPRTLEEVGRIVRLELALAEARGEQITTARVLEWLAALERAAKAGRPSPPAGTRSVPATEDLRPVRPLAHRGGR